MASLFSKLDGLMEMMENTEELNFDFSIGTVQRVILDEECINDQYVVSGSYKWTISNTDEIDKVLEAFNGDYYESTLFSIADTKWCIKLNPNGANMQHTGSFGVHLRLHSLPKLWESVVCRITIKCENPQYIHKQHCLFQRDNIGGTNCFMSLSELTQNNIKQLIFNVDVNILRVIAKKDGEVLYEKKSNNNYNKNTEMEWSINREFDAYRIGQAIQSKIYDNMWMIECYPNGDRSESAGFVTFSLRLFYLPPNISKLLIKWVIRCNETNKEKTMIAILHIDNIYLCYRTKLKQSEISSMSSISIKSSVLILDQYMIDKDNYISMDETTKEWNKYIQDFKQQNQTTNNNDQRTEYIINGYVRNIEEILKNLHDNNSYYTIPESIVQILFHLIDDYFIMNKGLFTWSMDQEFVENAILNAAVDSIVRSDIFEIGKLKWIVNIYPNKSMHGESDNFFSIYVALISMPSAWKSILVSLCIECIEMDRKLIIAAMYKQKDNTSWGTLNFLLIDKLKNLNPSQLTFIVKINISKIILNDDNHILYQCIYPKYKKNTKIELILNDAMMKSAAIHNIKQSETIQSDVVDDIWILECEVDANRIRTINLRLIGFPLNTLNLKVQWILYWKQQDLKYKHIHDFNEDKMSRFCRSNVDVPDWNNDSRLVIGNWTSHKTIEFMVKIVILEDFCGAVV